MKKSLKAITFTVALFICLIINQIAFSQNNHTLKWTINSSGASWDYISDIVMDSTGNFFAVGNYSGTIQLPNYKKVIEGENDIFLIKYHCCPVKPVFDLFSNLTN